MYQAIYKCRLCGEKFNETDFSECKELALRATRDISIKGNSRQVTYPCIYHTTNVHLCEDGSFGIADFQGFKKLEDNQECKQDIKTLETIEEIEKFLESEIANTKRRMKNPCVAFAGIGVSEWGANELNKSHIRFCKEILKIIEKSEE